MSDAAKKIDQDESQPKVRARLKDTSQVNEEGKPIIKKFHESTEDVAIGRPAGFWVRVFSSVIDAIVVAIGQGAINFVFGLAIPNMQSGAGAAIFVTILSSIVFPWVYWIGLTKNYGQTLGKMVMKLRVLPSEGDVDGLTYGQVFLREVIGKFISAIVFLIGFIRVGIADDKKGWHDLIAKTRVVHVES